MNHKSLKSVIVSSTLCMSMLANVPMNAFAANFEDVEFHWAKNAIEIWAEHGVIQGFEGMFRPDETITRAEMAVMIDKIMNYQEAAENTFSDLPQTWYTDSVLKLVKHGVLVGYDNQMRPEDPVTREEALVILARALQMKTNQNQTISFIDAENVSDWAAGAVQAMAERGFVVGFEDGTFRPQESMTRASSVTVVNNAIKGFYNKP